MKVLPYGTWPSSISASMVAASATSLGQIAIDGDCVYWVEGRPLEGGRQVLVRWDGSKTEDCTPPGFSVRTRINEYGGGAFAVGEGVVYFANFGDQRIYRQEPGRAATPVTPEAEARFGDLRLMPDRQRLLAIREASVPGRSETEHALVSIHTNGDGIEVLRRGADFYSSPALSPDGQKLAWLEWWHPNLPWDGTELWQGRLVSDRIEAPQRIAGGPEESIFQPSWSPRGELFFVSDRTGWWNLYRCRGAGPEPVLTDEGEYGLPQWNLGMSTYGFAGADEIVCARLKGGRWDLVSIALDKAAVRALDTPYRQISGVRAARGRVVFVGASPTQAARIVACEEGELRTLRESASTAVDATQVSRARPVDFPGEGGAIAHGLYYAPQNPEAQAPQGECPPLLVKCHGGPTAAASAALSFSIQYWTSRGFAVLDVNYAGSTGYGRVYRSRLDGQWGVADVADCIMGARYCAENGLADGERLLIAGGSAGGFTALCALTFHDLFRAGASYYGISDLERLLDDTHKFEARYMDRLLGPYPQARDVYAARSPLHAAGKGRAPIIFFQGLDDRVVPPSQTEAMVEALRRSGVPVAYVPFAAEQHGFRRAETIVRALEAERWFYCRILGIAATEPEDSLEIYNLPAPARTV